MMFFLIILAPIIVIGWVGLSFKVGLIVADWTANTGFDYGFYGMTTAAMIALPAAVLSLFY